MREQHAITNPILGFFSQPRAPSDARTQNLPISSHDGKPIWTNSVHFCIPFLKPGQYFSYSALFFTKFSMTYYQTDNMPLWSLCIDHLIYHHLFAMKLKFIRNFSVIFHHISSAKQISIEVVPRIKIICLLVNRSKISQKRNGLILKKKTFITKTYIRCKRTERGWNSKKKWKYLRAVA